MTVPQSKYAFIAPTYKQAKNIAWDILKEYAIKVDGVQFNEAELRADFKNKSRITLYGSDNPDALRGIGLWGVVYDEYSQQPSNIHTEIIRPALADHRGFAIWIGTPKGKNDFYNLYELAKNNDKWLALLLTVKDTNLIAEEELEDAKQQMTNDEFDQEWHCSFEAAIKGAYYKKELRQAREDGRITIVPYEQDLKVHTWWDLGIADATAIGFFQQHNKEWRMIDYYENSGEGLHHYAQYLQDKPYIYGKHIAPHDIKVRELGSGKSRLEMAESLGIKFEIAPKLEIIDGINAARMRFNTLWIDEKKCSRFINNLALYRKEWDDKTGQFKTRPLHDFTSHCLVGNTLIKTTKGSIAIENLDEDGYVYTPNGIQRYCNVRKTGIKQPVYEIRTSKGSIVATKEHKFLTNNGFVMLQDLREGDKIVDITMSCLIYWGIWKLKLYQIQFKNLMGKGFIFMKDTLVGNVLGDYIGLFGNIIMAKLKRVFIYTTRMEILPITNLITLPYKKQENIYHSIHQLQKQKKEVDIISKSMLNQKQFYGTNLKLGRNGTNKWQRKGGQTEHSSWLKRFVLFVEINTKHLFRQGQSIATRIVKHRHYAIVEKKKFKGYEDVYDLEVPNVHCFSLDNGLVVHNSADMLRYWAVTNFTTNPAHSTYYPKGHYLR